MLIFQQPLFELNIIINKYVDFISTMIVCKLYNYITVYVLFQQ